MKCNDVPQKLCSCFPACENVKHGNCPYMEGCTDILEDVLKIGGIYPNNEW